MEKKKWSTEGGALEISLYGKKSLLQTLLSGPLEPLLPLRLPAPERHDIIAQAKTNLGIRLKSEKGIFRRRRVRC